MWVGGGRCHLISDIFCSGGDGTASVRGLTTSRLFQNLAASLSCNLLLFLSYSRYSY